MGDTASSEIARLRDKIAELDKALKEARTALQTMERRATQLQNAQSEQRAFRKWHKDHYAEALLADENHVALRDAMNTINELKKQIETSKENSEQIRKLIQEKAAVNELLAASKEQLKGVQERLSVLSTQSASALQDFQAQRSRADGLQVRLAFPSRFQEELLLILSRTQGEYDAESNGMLESDHIRRQLTFLVVGRMYSHRLAEMDGHYKSLQVQMAHKEIEVSSMEISLASYEKY